MRLRFLTATLALFASITVLFTGFAAVPVGAAPITTATVAAISPDGVPDYCLTSNPPPICWVIQVDDDLMDKIDLGSNIHTGALVQNDFMDVYFGKGGIVAMPDPDDFASPCLRSNPPRWCWFADFDRSNIIDPDPTLVGPLDGLVIADHVGEALLDGHLFDSMISELVVTGGLRLG